MGDVYQKYRAELKQIIEYDNQNITWDMLEKFSHSLRNNDYNLKLYRYSSAEYFNIRNFEVGKIRLTKTADLNDIYEALPMEDISKLSEMEISLLNEATYVKCFCEENDNNLMWSHYADDHKGFCVEYDISELSFKDDVFNHIFPVIYKEKRSFGNDNLKEILEALHQFNCEIFEESEITEDAYLNDITTLSLFKSKDWEYEKEWRIIYSKYDVYTSKEVNDNNKMMEFDCATAIYLGYRINPEIKNNLIEIVKRINETRNKNHKSKIKIYDMKMKNGSYKLKAENLEGI